MPTQEQIEAQQAKRAEREAARSDAEGKEAAKQAARDKADAEARELAEKSEAQTAMKAAGKLKTPPPLGTTKSAKAKRRYAEKEAARQQAEEDARKLPEEVDTSLAAYGDGGKIPLNVLNAIASKADTAIKDEAREIAQAAGMAAYDAAAGKRGKYDIANRHRHKNEQIKRAATAAASATKS